MSNMFPIRTSKSSVVVLAFITVLTGDVLSTNESQHLHVADVLNSSHNNVLTLYVSPQGNDTTDGSSPTSALQHLEAARDRLRQLRGSHGSVTQAVVHVLGGTFELPHTLNLTAVDSNTTWSGVINSSAAANMSIDDLPVVSGGSKLEWSPISSVPITTHHTDRGKKTTCQLLTVQLLGQAAAQAYHTGLNYPQLYVDGQRARVARAPADALDNSSSFYEWHSAMGNASASAFSYDATAFDPGMLAPTNDSTALSDVSAFIFDAPWSAVPRRVAAINATSETIQLLSPPLKSPLITTSYVGVKRWVALNVQAGDLAPNTFRYRSSTQTLSYNYCRDTLDTNDTIDTMDHNDVRPESDPRVSLMPTSAVVSRLTTLVRVNSGAENIRFESLRFSHASVGVEDPPTFSYGAPMHGAVELGPVAAHVLFDTCVFALVGADALHVWHQVSDVVVRGCAFIDVGGRGFTTTVENTGSAKQDVADVVVADSVFNGCGQVYMEQPFCIFVSGANNISVLRNDVTNVAYSGIRVWGHFSSTSDVGRAFDSGASAVFNISGNHVHNVGLSLFSDFGAIFVTTRPGSGASDCVARFGNDNCNVLALVTNNVIHGVRHHDHGGAGIYTDESSGRTNITNNLVFNASGWGVHIHCGWKHLVQNNIFAGNAAVTPAPFPTYQLRDYALEPFCNFGYHPTSSQGVVVQRNVFDQSVSPSSGIGRLVSILNNNTLGKSNYGNKSSLLSHATLDLNLYSCFDDIDDNANYSGDARDKNIAKNNTNVTNDDKYNGKDSNTCMHGFIDGESFKQWQAWSAQDTHSVVGDPGFGDNPHTTLALRRDFRVDPSRSPSLKSIGFHPFTPDAGPRATSLKLGTCSNIGGDVGVWWNGCEVGALSS
eukprot:m.264827 g.264827  ORF g.264827 m.264827 type:complete len:883 (-) comp58457_c0_seq1:215-2863(-)